MIKHGIQDPTLRPRPENLDEIHHVTSPLFRASASDCSRSTVGCLLGAVQLEAWSRRWRKRTRLQASMDAAQMRPES